jgi:transcription-repair coupling factor (superfamily II helicase)
MKNKIESIKDLKNELKKKHEELKVIELSINYDIINTTQYLKPANILSRFFSSFFSDKKINNQLINQTTALTINYLTDKFILRKDNIPDYLKNFIKYVSNNITYNIANANPSKTLIETIKEAIINI